MRIQRVGIGGQAVYAAPGGLDEQGVVSGNVLMDIAERKLRIRAFQPKCILRERHLQNDVVHLVGTGEVGQQPFVGGADYRIGGRDAQLVQHGTGVVGKSLAVAESGAADVGGGNGLQSSDTQLDADVAGGLCQIIVDGFHFFAVGCAVCCQFVQLAFERFGEQVAVFEKAVLPLSVLLPCAHVALLLVETESGRGEIYARE